MSVTFQKEALSRKSQILFFNGLSAYGGQKAPLPGKSPNAHHGHSVSTRTALCAVDDEYKREMQVQKMEEDRLVRITGNTVRIDGSEFDFVHSSIHTVDGKPCICSVSVWQNSIRVQAMENRNYNCYIANISFACVANLMIDYCVNNLHGVPQYPKRSVLEGFWSTLTHSLRMNGTKVELSPSPISTIYAMCVTSTGAKGVTVWEANKVVGDEIWHVSFISEYDTMVLEIAMTKLPLASALTDSGKPCQPYRIDSVFLKKLFFECCVEGEGVFIASSDGYDDGSVSEQISDILANQSGLRAVHDSMVDEGKPPQLWSPKRFFDRLLEDILSENDSDKFIISCVEALVLDNYAKKHISVRNSNKMEHEFALVKLKQSMRICIRHSIPDSDYISAEVTDRLVKNVANIAITKYTAEESASMSTHIMSHGTGVSFSVMSEENDVDEEYDEKESLSGPVVYTRRKGMHERSLMVDSVSSNSSVVSQHSNTDMVPLVRRKAQLMGGRNDIFNEQRGSDKETKYSFQIVLEVLAMDPSRRQTYYRRDPVIQVLKSCNFLSKSMAYCSDKDWAVLASYCILKEFTGLGEAEGSGVVATKGEYIDHCFIILRGLCSGLNDNERKVYSELDFVGDHVLLVRDDENVADRKGVITLRWNENLIANTSLIVCAIPVELLLRHVGISYLKPKSARKVKLGKGLTDDQVPTVSSIVAYMKCFWKFAGLLRMILTPKLLIQYVKELKDQYDQIKKQERLAALTANYDDSGEASIVSDNTVKRDLQNIDKLHSDKQKKLAIINMKIDCAMKLPAQNEHTRLLLEPVFSPLPVQYQVKDESPEETRRVELAKIFRNNGSGGVDGNLTFDEFPSSLLSLLKESKTSPVIETVMAPYCPDIIESVRVRVFQPNSNIFEECSQNRHFMYLMISGECKYRRKVEVDENFEKDTKFLSRKSKGLSQSKIDFDIGIHLFPGDFSFMDGETFSWLELNRKNHHGMIHNSAQYKGKFRPFDTHKYTLVSVVRSEICVIPLSEISKSAALFARMLSLMNTKYPTLHETKEEFLRRFVADSQKALIKTSALKEAELMSPKKSVNKGGL